MIISSIDIGTNTVLLLIASVDEKTRALITIRNEIRLPRLGKGLVKGGRINNEKIDLLLQVLFDYRKILENYNPEKTIVIATNAFRIAGNSKEIQAIVKEKLNWEIEIISGNEEAELAYLSASSLFTPMHKNLVIDIGGGSTEIIIGNNIEIQNKKSFPIGSVIATEKFLPESPPTIQQLNNLDSELNEMFSSELLEFEIKNAIAIAGTPTTLACMVNNLKDFDENIIEGSILTLSNIHKIQMSLSALTNEQILNSYGNVMTGREDLILSGAKILYTILKKFKLDSVKVSSRGIRHGVLIKYINNFYG